MFTYKHKNTGEVVSQEKPIKGHNKRDYILLEWKPKNMQARGIIKK